MKGDCTFFCSVITMGRKGGLAARGEIPPVQADHLAVAGRTSELVVRQESKALGFAANHRRA
jgi:hypothetical protein